MTQGSLIHKNDPPKKEADPIVAKLKSAGAIPVLPTTVPEFYLNFVTATKAWGVTRNPWNLKYAVGGSSGGSGAALAAGYVTLATGSDMGGSVRIPCAFDGLYGMKIAYLGGMGVVEPTQEVAAAMQNAIKVLKTQGAQVDTLKFDFELAEPLLVTFKKVALAGSLGGMFAGYGDDLDKMTPYAHHFIEATVCGGFGNKNALAAENILRQLYAKLADEVYAKGYDIIIVPTLPTSHVPADYDFTVDEALVEDGREFPKSLGAQYTLPFNFMNWNPVVRVPAGISSQGMRRSACRLSASPTRHSDRTASGLRLQQGRS